MPVSSNHFIDGKMKAKCVASVSPVLWQGNQESIVQRVAPLIDNREALVFGKPFFPLYIFFFIQKSGWMTDQKSTSFPLPSQIRRSGFFSHRTHPSANISIFSFLLKKTFFFFIVRWINIWFFSFFLFVLLSKRIVSFKIEKCVDCDSCAFAYSRSTQFFMMFFRVFCEFMKDKKIIMWYSDF